MFRDGLAQSSEVKDARDKKLLRHALYEIGSTLWMPLQLQA